MTVLSVGAGQQFSTLSSALAASHDGDKIQVQAGTYTNDFAAVNTKVTIQAVGGMARFVATAQPEKAILVTNTDVTIDGLEFSGARSSGENGAGIRYQAGNLTVLNSYFHDNEDGLLAAPNASGTITVANSEFAHNGTGDGYSHNLYVNDLAQLTIRGSYFHDAVLGHEIKSRAENTLVENSRVVDGAGTASYDIDLPNAGTAVIRNNLIEKGPNASNPNTVHFGGEGAPYAGSSLTVSGNTFVNDHGAATAVLNAAGAPATFSGNAVYGYAANQLVSGPGDVSGTTFLAQRPDVSTAHPWGAASQPAPAAGASSTSADPAATGAAATGGAVTANAGAGGSGGNDAGTKTATAPTATAPAPSTPDDTIVARVSADVPGSMRFAASLDGRALGNPTAQADDGAGGLVLTYAGQFGSGPHVFALAAASTTPGQVHTATLADVGFNAQRELASPVQFTSGSTELVAVNSGTDISLAVPTSSASSMIPVLQGMLT